MLCESVQTLPAFLLNATPTATIWHELKYTACWLLFWVLICCTLLTGEDRLEKGGLPPAGVCHRRCTSPCSGRQAGRPRPATRRTVSPQRQERVQRFHKDGKKSCPFCCLAHKQSSEPLHYYFNKRIGFTAFRENFSLTSYWGKFTLQL